MYSKPRVSVIVPAYNVSNYIEASLTSLKKQKLTEFEVLVVDDGSTDDTAAIVERFIEGDSRFKLLKKPNGGLSSARNHGIMHAQSDYIALLDADDLYHNEKLKSHIDLLEKRPDIGVVYSASRAIREDGDSTLITISGKPIYKDTLLALLCKNFVGHGSNAVFRKIIFDEIGGFDESLRSCEDLDYWLRITDTRKWQFLRIPKILCYYRVRPSGLSFNVTQMQQTQSRVMKAAYDRCPELVGPMIPTAKAYMFRYLARLALASGDVSSSKKFIDQAWSQNSSIFYRDFRSLITLIAIKFSPISQYFIKQALGSTESARKRSS